MYCLIFISEMDTTGMKIVKVRGVKFQIDSSGKTLKRLDNTQFTGREVIASLQHIFLYLIKDCATCLLIKKSSQKSLRS